MQKKHIGTRSIRSKHKKNSGQSVVEVALFLPLLIAIVIVIIDFGIVFASYLSLVNATREGAIYAAMYPQLAITNISQCTTQTGSPTVSSPATVNLSYSGSSCVTPQDSQGYGGGAGVTNTVHIWDEYTNRIQNDVFTVIGEQLEASQLADTDQLYIDRPILAPATDSTCPLSKNSGCPITVTVHYRIHTFTSDMSLPGYGRFGLPNYYQINYSVGMPIR